jgi:hypothetical protein
MCQTVKVCKVCVSPHITHNPSKIHTFLPISSQALINAGVDHYSVVRRSAIDRSYKLLLKDEINSIESFKQSTLTAIQRRTEHITGLLNVLIDQKIQELTRDVELSKAVGDVFADSLTAAQIDLENHDTNAFFKNVIAQNPNLKGIRVFKSTYEERREEYEEELQKLENFSIACPTEQLFELTRTPEEYKDWLDVLRQRQEEELKKQEKVLKRFEGEYGGWSVGGPPSVDATAFTVDHDIWMTGLGMGNANTSGGSCAIQDLEICQGASTRGTVLYRHPITVTSTWDGSEDNKYFKIVFTEPVKLPKGSAYTIRIQYSSGGGIWAAGGTIVNSVEEVNFTFTQTSCDGGDSDNNGNAVTAGPTRDIYFALAEVKL